MKKLLMAAALCACATALAAPAKRTIYLKVRANEDKAFLAQNKKGTAQLFADVLSSKTWNALIEKYPCYAVTREQDVVTLLEWERQKQLLGAGDEEALAQMANALGTKYLLEMRIHMVGKKVFLRGALLDQQRAKAVAVDSSWEDYEGEDTFETVEDFAKSFVEGLDIPGCQKVWVGNVSVTQLFTEETGPRTSSTSGATTTMSDTSEVRASAKLQVDASSKKSSAEYNWSSTSTTVTVFTGECAGRHVGTMRVTAAGHSTVDVNIEQDGQDVKVELGSIPVEGKMEFTQEASGCAKKSEGDEITVPHPGAIHLSGATFQVEKDSERLSASKTFNPPWAGKCGGENCKSTAKLTVQVDLRKVLP